jgi:competence protein ComFB
MADLCCRPGDAVPRARDRTTRPSPLCYSAGVMALRDDHDFDALVNDAESMVIDALEDAIARTPGVCTCRDCVLDMAACALNNVRPSYRVSLLGSMSARSDRGEEYARQVRQAVADAVERVQKNRSHD